ncbi:MAG TPA: LpxD N-terminal domain-containing protein, partial [Bacteroidia bacterium]|nr:LpxD N-terminal domain-containing protein [Bacteroidia bacterium]
MSQFTAQQIADLLKGTVEGNPQVIVSKLSKIEEGITHSVSFLSNPVYTPHIYTTDASVVIVSKDLVLEKPIKSTCTLVRVTDPRASFGVLLDAYNQINNDNKKGIEQPSFISSSAIIGKNVYIGAFTYIGDYVKIGDNVKIHPNSFIGNNVVIADNTII